MVILDTDHLTVIQRQSQPIYSVLTTRIRHIPASDLRTTIINVEEQMRGWLAVIGRSRQIQQEIAAYRHLYALLSFFGAIPILEFDEPAAQRFLQLRRSRLRLGSMDLKIAAIAISRGATLLSRNLNDFRRVPGLSVQDWTQGT
jgi:tRNA(fMet)-specific endonuclease VapC